MHIYCLYILHCFAQKAPLLVWAVLALQPNQNSLQSPHHVSPVGTRDNWWGCWASDAAQTVEAQIGENLIKLTELSTYICLWVLFHILTDHRGKVSNIAQTLIWSSGSHWQSQLHMTQWTHRKTSLRMQGQGPLVRPPLGSFVECIQYFDNKLKEKTLIHHSVWHDPLLLCHSGRCVEECSWQFLVGLQKHTGNRSSESTGPRWRPGSTPLFFHRTAFQMWLGFHYQGPPDPKSKIRTWNFSQPFFRTGATKMTFHSFAVHFLVESMQSVVFKVLWGRDSEKVNDLVSGYHSQDLNGFLSEQCSVQTI